MENRRVSDLVKKFESQASGFNKPLHCSPNLSPKVYGQFECPRNRHPKNDNSIENLLQNKYFASDYDNDDAESSYLSAASSLSSVYKQQFCSGSQHIITTPSDDMFMSARSELSVKFTDDTSNSNISDLDEKQPQSDMQTRINNKRVKEYLDQLGDSGASRIFPESESASGDGQVPENAELINRNVDKMFNEIFNAWKDEDMDMDDIGRQFSQIFNTIFAGKEDDIAAAIQLYDSILVANVN